LRDFDSIRSALGMHYKNNNNNLPLDLNGVDLSGYNLKDPKTKQEYEYRALGQYDFELCTDFDTEFKDTNYGSTNNYIDRSHNKGRDCIKYQIDEYYKATPLPTPIVVADPNYGMRLVIGTISSLEQNNNGTYKLLLKDVTYFESQAYIDGLIINDLTQISGYNSPLAMGISDLEVGYKVTVNFVNNTLIVKTVLVTSK